MTRRTVFPPALLLPKHWPLWLGVGCLWCCAQLPFALQSRIGRFCGRTLYHLAPRRRHIADVNLKLCFPELPPAARTQLLHQHFVALGLALMEVGIAWWTPRSRLLRAGKLIGAEHAASALAQGRGVLLLGAHYTTLEISAALLSSLSDVRFSIVYRPHENPVVEYLFQRQRVRSAKQAIARDDIKGMVRALRAGQVVWFAPDQNYGHKHSLFSPFFGVAAATNTATSRLAKLTGAVVVPFASRRQRGTLGGYEVEFLPPLQDFPSDDVQQDTDRLNEILATQIRRAPEQYLWIHRRFKDRPPGERDVYDV